ncbi:hypothetical protein CKM354_001040900 [Cercospora kikuchii]|uniref:Uncharacterized protein n=1 Tax=Cercospora kikuchii TaxID=84275 RepID=A0A9P3CQX9_9PEZI|nr:uncharacterized protein CKM354_001040900 [Cercospora kikuchii]GIZ47314.1 hypothetical protein CKM354_001040900 [Cercospora kikuchii]
MMPLLLLHWKATLLRSEPSQLLPTALFKLIVMMLVIDGSPMYLEDVETQILSTFNYYNWETVRAQARRRCTVAEYNRNRDYDGDNDDDDETEVLPDFYDAVEEFEHPSCIGNLKDYSKRRVNLEFHTFSITTGAARLYLRNRLEPARKGVFHFMKLPAELREKICRMLLIYPKSGLVLARTKSTSGTVTGKCTDWASLLLMIRRIRITEQPGNALKTTIRHEALPIFYGHNSFHFDSLPLLIRALQVITEETAQQIQDLRIDMECRDSDLHKNALQELNKSIVKLSPKKLTLIVCRDYFWDFCDGEGYPSKWKTSPAPAGVHKLDGSNGLGGLVTLAKSVDHLQIFGDGFLRAWLEERTKKAEMGQLAKAVITENA